MTNAIIIKAGAGADTFVKGDTAEEVHPDAGRRRVGDAHLTDTEEAATLGDAVVNEVGADLYRAVELLLAHRRLVEEVFRAAGYLAVKEFY